MLSDEAQTIVSHFVQHMPHAVREVYEAKVCEMLKAMTTKQGAHHDNIMMKQHRHADDEAMQATQACVEVMHAMWEQERTQFQIRDAVTEVVPSGGSL